MEGHIDRNVDTTGESIKKKRGRPRKSDTVLPPREFPALSGVTPTSDSRTKKARLTDANIQHPSHGNGSLVGQPVHGVLDGSFDAGYLISVTVGDSDTILRGVVFGPGLSVPPSKTNDIAPKVRSTDREVNIPFPRTLYLPSTATPAALSEIYEPFPVADYTPTESGATPENGIEHQQNHAFSDVKVQQDHAANNQVQSTHAGAPSSTR